MKEETERRLRDQSGAGAKEKTGDGKSVLNRILRRWKVADNASVHNETEEAEEMEEVEEVEEVEETEDETTGSLDSGAVMPVKIPALSRNTSLALGGGEEDEDSELPPNIITSTSSTSSDCLADRKISTVVTESGPLESSGSRDANPLKVCPATTTKMQYFAVYLLLYRASPTAGVHRSCRSQKTPSEICCMILTTPK